MVFTITPFTASANVTINDFATSHATVAAVSAVVIDQSTGEVLFSKNASESRVPASLTKLVTALVVLDTKPNMNKLCTMRPEDEVGGARINTYVGAQYKLGDLLNAALVASANNAASAVAHCIGIGDAQFVSKMNEKAQQFNATHTHFVEPTGMDPANATTAEDFARIANAALSTKKIQDIVRKKSITISTVGTLPKKTHYLKTTDLLLHDSAIRPLGGKTGYLDESLYNFVGSFKNPNGRFIITVVLGSPDKQQSFADTKSLVTSIIQSDKLQASVNKNFVVASK